KVKADPIKICFDFREICIEFRKPSRSRRKSAFKFRLSTRNLKGYADVPDIFLKSPASHLSASRIKEKSQFLQCFHDHHRAIKTCCVHRNFESLLTGLVRPCRLRPVQENGVYWRLKLKSFRRRQDESRARALHFRA